MIIEQPNGTLGHFNWLGYIVMAVSLVSVTLDVFPAQAGARTAAAIEALVSAPELRLVESMTAPFERAYADALLHHRQGRLKEADRLYAEALAFKPDLVEAHNNRGAIRQMAGDWAGALSCYDAAIRFRPDYAEGLANRGNVLIQLRRYDEALASFDRALAQTPSRPSALNCRAGVPAKRQRFDSGAGRLRAVAAS